ncbi:MAG: alpha/beta hydrolase, partial [Candidatus Eremiobacteraeota bacterium]|nr:alpha/beta hydrolase [Candidatus Eremiobacteraeota bacterium]
SHGGVTAYLTAARYPQLVRALVVIEAGVTNDADAPHRVARWLDSWPLPFPDLAAAQQFFGGDTPAARTWAASLVRREHGYVPAFRRDDVLASVRDHESTATYESDWAAVRCPTLLVVGERGWIRASDVETMRALQPKLCVANIPGAGHDVHIEAPSELRRAAEAFFSGLPDA